MAVADRAVVIELEAFVVDPVVDPVVLVASTSVDLQDSKLVLKPSRISKKIVTLLRFIMFAEYVLSAPNCLFTST